MVRTRVTKQVLNWSTVLRVDATGKIETAIKKNSISLKRWKPNLRNWPASKASFDPQGDFHWFLVQIAYPFLHLLSTNGCGWNNSFFKDPMGTVRGGWFTHDRVPRPRCTCREIPIYLGVVFAGGRTTSFTNSSRLAPSVRTFRQVFSRASGFWNFYRRLG